MKQTVKISTEIYSAARIVGEERAIEYCAKAGFDAWDFSMFSMCRYDWDIPALVATDHPLAKSDYLAFARKLKNIGLDNGIVCNQSHAPFRAGCPEIRPYVLRAIECTAEAGGKICIVHPDNYLSPEENAEMYFELLPFAKEHGVIIATENMFNWPKDSAHATPAACSSPESFHTLLDAVNDPSFVACLDIGHAEMKGLDTSAVEMIHTLGTKLAALHIHDNNKWNDSHQIPFSMDIDFDAVINALREIGYSGDFTLEAESYLKAYTEENVLDGLKNMALAARKLTNMFIS